MRADHNGFTLLEVMVAMSILAMSLVAVFHMQSQSIAMSADARFRTTASLLAAGKMADLEGDPGAAREAQKGDFAPDYPEFAWSARVTGTGIARLMKIEVTVFYKGAEERDVYRLVLYKTSGM
ncbi:MAG: prepilin-type N-terminal cleavage/methylation domain-containing protein [Smithellaceae bacterium]|jgi:general secretion pathway protein I|nr:prepilin-type N-terminal cleavage/methylation domain-containing protein [Syntrophaceae bacterium]MDD4242089.1 prepilin-type N-terminal cleavage/methylation domain-containing protein [Smithellaceae bacterium]NLX53349.1 prepilin-type N-terminal cleavage/methylation domain-containing protein [Deltaproteobacteria bacterium]